LADLQFLTVRTPRFRVAALSYGSEKSAPSGRASRAAVRSSCSEKGVRLTQKMQVDPYNPVGV
jgi:hypothetical protein